MTKLDPLERKIINALQRDGDLSHAKLADKVGASSASCWRRVRALQAAGVFGPAVRLVNPAAVGKNVSVLCQIKVVSQDPASRESFEKLIAMRDEIVEGYSMTGDWDYLLLIIASDLPAFEAFLMKEILSHPAVASSSSLFALKRIKYTTAIPV